MIDRPATAKSRQFGLTTTRSVVVAQLAMGPYRQAFLDELARLTVDTQTTITFLCGERYIDNTTQTDVESPLTDVADRNRFMLGRRVAYQRTVVWALLRSDVAVVEFNPRILTSWIVILARRVARRRVLVWGHLWPRAGEDSPTRHIRNLMRRLSHGVIVYTAAQADELLRLDRGAKVWVAPNALYSRNFIKPVVTDGTAVVYVGRLVRSKRIDVLIRSLPRLLAAESDIGPIRIVGDGPERESLEQECIDLGVDQLVQFCGRVDHPSALYQIYDGCFCAVNPGYVGLSATQAAGFGVPLVYGDDEPHAPELAALDEGSRRSFAAGSASDLASVIGAVYQERAYWRERRSELSNRVAMSYSAESMASGFLEAVTG